MLLCFDAQAIAYRGFFALQKNPLRSHKGFNTSAVYYFDRLVRSLLKKHSPQYALVALDSPEPTFRHTKLEHYKENRPKTPDELSDQMGIISQLAKALGLRVISKPGYEADDIIATATLKAKERGVHVLIVSSDKDLMSLVDDGVSFYNLSDERIYTPQEVREKFGIPPQLMVDYLVLVGDPTDNIPGVKGIGKKTALKLLLRYGSLENILKNSYELPERIRKALSQHDLSLMKELISLRFDPSLLEIEDLEVKQPDRDVLIRIYRELDLFSALEDMSCEPDLPGVLNYSGQAFKAFYLKDHLYLSDGEAVYRAEGADLTGKFTLDLKTYVKSKGNLPKAYDLSILDYLISPDLEESKTDRHGLKSLALKYKAWKVPKDTAVFVPYLCALIGDEILSEASDLMVVYERIEHPLIEVLAHMETVGIKVDVHYLEHLLREYDSRLKRITDEIYSIAGMEFNLNSHKKLSYVLFEVLKLPPIRRTKGGGFSTDREVLEELSKYHPLPKLILNYRELSKLKTTYVQALLRHVSSDGRIHPTFSQTTTATGRLSCYNPNLQNIPRRDEIRRAFVAEDGYLFADYDYSQIELRILAHLSGDENLKEVFFENRDVHAETARALFGGEVTPETRRIAKAVNFGIVYGITPYGLAKLLGIEKEQAKQMIERYYSAFPGVKAWQEEVVEFASRKGYVETMFGRRRYIHTDPTKNEAIRKVVINTPVQGSAADLMKLAMIEVFKLLKGTRSRMVLQVHDELLLEVHEDETHILQDVKRVMEEVVELDVPLSVSLEVGPKWTS